MNAAQEILSLLDANIAVVNQEGVITTVNKGWENFAGENTCGKVSLVGVGADYLDVCKKSLESGDESAGISLKGILSVLNGSKNEFHQEYPCHSPSQKRWFSMRVRSLSSKQGAVIIHTDISHQKKDEQQLRASLKTQKKSNNELALAKRRLDLAQATAKIGSYEWDGKNSKVIWSDELYRIFGYEPQSFKVTMESMNEKIHPDDIEAVKAKLAQIQEEKRGLDFGYRIINPKTGIRYLEGTGKVELNEKGEIAFVTGSFQDVTERKRAAEKLLASEANTRILFEYSPILIWEEDFSEVKSYLDALKKSGITDYRSHFQNAPQEVERLASLVKVTQVNKRSLEFYGVESLEELNMNIGDWFVEDSMDVFKEELIALAEGHADFEGEIPVITPSGDHRHLFTRLFVPPRYMDTLKKVIVSFIDITEIKKTKEQLRQLNVELEQKVAKRTQELLKSRAKLKKALEKQVELNELKSRFVSMASHEFRTPLTAIQSSVDLLRRYNEIGDLDKQKKHFKRIRSSVNNMTTILNDFLSLEKMESGEISINLQKLEFGVYIQEVLTQVQPWTKENQKIVHEHKGSTEVRIDPYLTQNILLNILSNALKYSPRESIVDLVTENLGDKLLIKATDYGIGIPEEDQKSMFSRFFRASNVMEIGGTGLGLTIVKHYLDLLGGGISFASKAGKGTTFNITLPLG